MQINLKLNGKLIKEEIADELLLIDFVRKHGCYSVKTADSVRFFWMENRSFPVHFWQPEPMEEK